MSSEAETLERIATQLSIAARYAKEGTLPSLLEYAGMLFNEDEGHLPTNILRAISFVSVENNQTMRQLGKLLEAVIAPTGFHVMDRFKRVHLDAYNTGEPFFYLFYGELHEVIGKIDPCTRRLHFDDAYLTLRIASLESARMSNRGSNPAVEKIEMTLEPLLGAKEHFNALVDVLGAYGITIPVKECGASAN